MMHSFDRRNNYLRRKSTATHLVSPSNFSTIAIRRTSKQSTSSNNDQQQIIGHDDDNAPTSSSSIGTTNVAPIIRPRTLSSHLSGATDRRSLLPLIGAGGILFELNGVSKSNNNVTCWHQIGSRLQWIYEKSHVHYLFPILILIAYSLIGGFVFYTIESPHEMLVLKEKQQYINNQTDILFKIILRIRDRIHHIRGLAHINRYDRYKMSVELRIYQAQALNDLSQAVYWYALTVYYLTDHESYKSTALHPDDPESRWAEYFKTSFGRIFVLKNYTEQLSMRCWEIGLESNGDEAVTRRKLNESLTLFNRLTGLGDVLRPTWTFWNSMFLAVTTYTTIGYGNIAPKTRTGMLAAIIYAVVVFLVWVTRFRSLPFVLLTHGIPLVLMILHKLGRFFLQGLQRLWDALVWTINFLQCVKQPEKLKSQIVLDTATGGRESYSIPVLLAVGVTFGWMFFCAAIFLKFEKNWDYFKSFYFFFISLTTIGYGDVTPTNSEDMFIIFGFIIIGLSLVSMCINVAQIKLEHFFEELLLMMMEEYENAHLSDVDGAIIGPPPDIQNAMGMMQMWRMWKRRRQRKQAESLTSAIANPDHRTSATSSTVSSTVAAGDTIANKVRQRMKLSLPFGRRRRDLLIDELHRLLYQVSRSTQTDDEQITTTIINSNRPQLPFNLLTHHAATLYQVPEMEVAPSPTIELSHMIDNDLSSFAICDTAPVSTYQPLLVDRKVPLAFGTQHCHQTPPVSIIAHSSSVPMIQIGGGETSSSSSTSAATTSTATNTTDSSLRTASSLHCSSTQSSSQTSGYLRRGGLRGYHHQWRSRGGAGSNGTDSPTSIQSAPSFALLSSASSRRRESDESDEPSTSFPPVDFDPSRRWTFVETRKAPKGAPRGLIVPTMYVKNRHKQVYTTDVQRLIKEIDLRLRECRTLVAASPQPSDK